MGGLESKKRNLTKEVVSSFKCFTVTVSYFGTQMSSTEW